MAETVLLQESDIMVTSARLVIGAETLPIPNITRVSTHRSGALQGQWRAIGFLLCCGLPFTYFAKAVFDADFWFFVNIAVVAGAFITAATRPTPLVLFVGMSDGARELMLGRNDAIVARTHEAVLQALSMR